MKVYLAPWYAVDQQILWFRPGASAAPFLDHYASQLLAVANTVPTARSVLAAKKWLSTLFSLFLAPGVSTELRIRILRVLRQVLPVVTPTQATELLFEKKPEEKQPGFLDYMFSTVAHGVRSQDKPASGAPSIYTETVLLIRHLLAHPDTGSEQQKAWHTAVTGFMKNALKNFNQLVANVHRSKPDGTDVKVDDPAVGHALATLYIIGGHALSHSAFLSDAVDGVMSSVRGTLSSYDTYYYRLCDLFKLVGNLQIPDKSGNVPKKSNEPQQKIPAGLAAIMEQMIMTGFEINQIRSALIQTGGELQAAMNLIVDGKVEDKDVTNEWGAFLTQLDQAEKERQEIKSGVINTPKKTWNALKEITDIVQKLHEVLEQYGTLEDGKAPPYTKTEFKLFRLAMATGIVPRSKAKPLGEQKLPSAEAIARLKAVAAGQAPPLIVGQGQETKTPGATASVSVSQSQSSSAATPATATASATATATATQPTVQAQAEAQAQLGKLLQQFGQPGSPQAGQAGTSPVVMSESLAALMSSFGKAVAAMPGMSTQAGVTVSSPAAPGSSSTTAPAGTTVPKVLTGTFEELAGVAPKPAAKKPVKPESKKLPLSGAGGAGAGYGPDGEANFWAKGTGYGHGNRRSNWDPDAEREKLEKKNKLVKAIIQEIVDDLMQEELPAGMAAALEQSCVVPMLEAYLKNDSIVDMERQSDLYFSMLSLAAAMVRHIDTSKLFLPLSNQRTSLHALLHDMEKQAKIADKFEAADLKESKEGKSKVSLAKRIVEVAHAVNTKLRPIIKAQQLKESLERTGKEEKVETDQFVVLLKEFRFKEVKEFKMHHYWNQAKEEKGAINRTYMRRLQHEYADLSKSLPIFKDSSIFMRVQEGNMSLAQILVTAPLDTPYARGCFLFDVYFPPTYPNTPPLVNLQTTGNNSVRFNPNLYNSGKVCLSLLGTWSGSKEEQWNSKSSTFLQVCVSLQSLIFVSEPFFNEPGYERELGTPSGRAKSDEYNSNIRAATVKWAMVDMLRNPPKGFEYPVLTHFFLQKDIILKQVEGWCSDGVSKGAHLASLKALYGELKGLLNKLEQPVKPANDSDDDE